MLDIYRIQFQSEQYADRLSKPPGTLVVL